MDFALKILGKYGWKEGEGLGKNSNGIVKPLKATLKFDNAGFGSDLAAADFNNHWWERVFNEAASSVDVKQEGATIKMDLKNGEDGVEISTRGYSMKKLKKAKRQREKDTANGYHNFLQAATLTNLGGEIENPNKIDASDIEVTNIKVLTDDELFRACGGRTAHKGARHGLKLSGKLSRIEQQEQELVEKILAKRNNFEEAKKRSPEKTQDPIKKKKKPKSSVKLDEAVIFQECENELKQNIEIKRKNKKKHTKEDNLEQNTDSQEISEYIIKNNKKKHTPELETEPSTEQSATDVTKKKKKKNKEALTSEETVLKEDSEVEIVYKCENELKQNIEIKRKNKRKHIKEDNLEQNTDSQEISEYTIKNNKKKHTPELETEPSTEQCATDVVTKKKKKKNKEDLTSEETELKVDSVVEIVHKKKKSKKKSRDQE